MKFSLNSGDIIFQKLTDWFFNSFMISNFNKTCPMIFNGPKSRFNQSTIMTHNISLNIVDSQKFLGIFFDEDLSKIQHTTISNFGKSPLNYSQIENSQRLSLSLLNLY